MTDRKITTYEEGTEDEAKLARLLGVVFGDTKLFDTNLLKSLTKKLVVSKSIGEIPVGKVWDKGSSFEVLFNDLFDPIINPTFSYPSLTIKSSVPTVLESGYSGEVTLTLLFNRGSIDIEDVRQSDLTGSPQYYEVNDSRSEVGIYTVLVDSVNASFHGLVKYSEGPQPKNNRGDDYGEPYPEGQVDSWITFIFTEALWANNNSIDEITKQPILNPNIKSIVFEYPPATESNPETFDIPAYWRLKSIKVENPLTGNWDDCETEFSYSGVTHENLAGESIQYSRYYCNLGYDMASRKIMVTWY